jgi:uncharacterized membrane protein
MRGSPGAGKSLSFVRRYVSDPDPLTHAEVLAAYGRKSAAVELLRDAIDRNPERRDLRERLNALTTKRTLPAGNRLVVVFHLTMAWVLLLACGGLVFGAPVSLARLFDNLPPGDFSNWEIVWFLVGLLIVVVLLAIAWVYLFLVVWFSYLGLLPNDLRKSVEERVPSMLNIVAFEPAYTKVRSWFLRDDGA